MNERSSYFCPSIGQIVQPDSSPLELDDRWMCPPRQVIIQYAAIHLLLSQMQSFILSHLIKFSNTKFFSRGKYVRADTLTGTLYVIKPISTCPVSAPTFSFSFRLCYSVTPNKQASSSRLTQQLSHAGAHPRPQTSL